MGVQLSTKVWEFPHMMMTRFQILDFSFWMLDYDFGFWIVTKLVRKLVMKLVTKLVTKIVTIIVTKLVTKLVQRQKNPKLSR